jgi:hypothetical protein
MRTTLTVDPDVEQLLKQAMHDENLGMKAALNAALRRGLVHQKPALPPKPFRVEAKAMGLRRGLDPARLQDLADEIELEAFATTTSRLRKAKFIGNGA